MNDEAETNKKRSRRLYEEIFGRGNYAVADDLMAADIVSHGPGSPPMLGTKGIKRQAVLLRTAIPDLRATLNDQFGHDDRVVSRWTGNGTHTGPLNLPTGPVAATGNSISFAEIRIDRHTGGASWSRGGYPIGSRSGSNSACCRRHPNNQPEPPSPRVRRRPGSATKQAR